MHLLQTENKNIFQHFNNNYWILIFSRALYLYKDCNGVQVDQGSE